MKVFDFRVLATNVAAMGAAAGGGGGGGTSAAYTNFAARYTNSPDTTHRNAYGGLLDGMTTAGFFDGSGNPQILDFIHIHSSDVAGNAQLNLMSSSYPLTPQGSPSFTADQGWTLNGSSQYHTTGYTPNGSNLWGLNAATLGVFIHTNRTSSNTSIAIGAKGATDNDTSQVLACYTGAGGKTLGGVNAQQMAINTNTGTVTARGITAVIRSIAGSQTIYKYIASGTPETATQGVSNTETSTELFVGARNNNGTPDSYTTDLIGADFGGANMDQTHLDNLAGLINQFMIDVSAPYHW